MQSSEHGQIMPSHLPFDLQEFIDDYFGWYNTNDIDDNMFVMLEYAILPPDDDMPLEKVDIARLMFFYHKTKLLMRILQEYSTIKRN